MYMWQPLGPRNSGPPVTLDLSEAVKAHPTFSEVNMEAAADWKRLCIHLRKENTSAEPFKADLSLKIAKQVSDGPNLGN